MLFRYPSFVDPFEHLIDASMERPNASRFTLADGGVLIVRWTGEAWPPGGDGCVGQVVESSSAMFQLGDMVEENGGRLFRLGSITTTQTENDMVHTTVTPPVTPPAMSYEWHAPQQLDAYVQVQPHDYAWDVIREYPSISGSANPSDWQAVRPGNISSREVLELWSEYEGPGEGDTVANVAHRRQMALKSLLTDLKPYIKQEILPNGNVRFSLRVLR